MNKLFTATLLAFLLLSNIGQAKVNHEIVLTYDHSGCYHVKKGDTLWEIARARYGDGRKWREIYDRHKANGNSSVPDHIKYREGRIVVNLWPGGHLWLHDVEPGDYYKTR